MDSVSPVWTEDDVKFEKVIALDQPDYAPIIGIPVVFNNGVEAMSVRFRFSEEEKKKIAEGCDLLITEMTFGQPFTPINLILLMPATDPNWQEGQL